MTVDFHKFVESLTTMIEAKDKYTAGHSDRVAELSYLIAKEMGFDEMFCTELHIGAHLHDIGKIGIPDGILLKSSKLTKAEYEVIKSHSTIGYDILKNNEGLKDIPLVIKYHHERVDGKGYPDGLAGEQIPIGARIIALADSFDAMVTSRVYKASRTMEDAVEEIKLCTGKQFDECVVRAFLCLIKRVKQSDKIAELFGCEI